MVFNKLTLAFPKEHEILFRKKYYTDSIFQFRISFLLVTLIYAAFGYLDTKVVPEYASLFQNIRFYFVVPFLSIVLLLSYTRVFKKIWQILLFLSFIVGSIGISIMTMLVPENYAYYAGLMLIFSAGYFFIKLRFLMASIAGWLSLLIFNVSAIFYAHVSNMVLINYNFFFISANLIGMFAAYNIEFYTRRDFFLNQALDKQKKVVENSNVNLEQIVEHRTKELIIAKNKAEQADSLKSAFLANMSHEIRTPMNGILGFAELLKEPELTGEQQQFYVDIIEKSGIRMLNIINDIIDISKLESGLVELVVSKTDINLKIEAIANFFKPEAAVKGIQILTHLPKDSAVAIINTDKEKVYAILTNLVKNAIKYTKTGFIEIGYKKKESFLEFYVKDTGVGIDKEQTAIIFERFRQASESRTRSFEGAGLGLSISKGYVEMLGGKIWVESELNKGTTFFFTLPASFA